MQTARIKGMLVGPLMIGLWTLTTATAQQKSPRPALREPVYRVANELAPRSHAAGSANVEQDATPAPDAEHPLDPALHIARESLKRIESIRDYTCTLVKKEQIKGTVRDYEYMTCKVRHERVENGELIPFSVYLNFRAPDSVRGREVIYLGGDQNGGKLTAHEGGLRGRFLPTVSLDPTSALAMRNNRYPITEIGIRTLTLRLIEKGQRDRTLGDCDVRFLRGAKVKDRVCTCLEVKHKERRPEYDFYLARIFLDNELQIPIRYQAFDWPPSPSAEPKVLEEYTYLNIKLNVGLTDADFDPANPSYRF